MINLNEKMKKFLTLYKKKTFKTILNFATLRTLPHQSFHSWENLEGKL